MANSNICQAMGFSNYPKNQRFCHAEHSEASPSLKMVQNQRCGDSSQAQNELSGVFRKLHKHIAQPHRICHSESRPREEKSIAFHFSQNFIFDNHFTLPHILQNTIQCALNIASITIIFFLTTIQTANSQPFTREIETIPVIINNDTISQPFSGGVDAPNHRFVDIDGDGDYDLYIFDADQIVDFYRNEGTPQQPIFKLKPDEFTLPHFTAWFLFAELNGDEKIDFLSDNGGNSIIYYINTGTKQEPLFTETANPLLDTSGQPVISGYIGIPTLNDLDGDNDLDIFASNFDGSVTFYQNIGAPFSPSFRYADGKFQGVTIVNDSCLKDSPILPAMKDAHHGGSILEFADINGDSAKDLFIGDLNSHRLFFLPNNGTSSSPTLQCLNMDFPPDGSLNTSGYNQPNLVDIDGDDDLDLFIGAFINMGPTNMQRRSFWFYENTGLSISPNFQLITRDYLSTLDVGREAHPAFLDINQDSLLDLVIGNSNGQLWYFQNTGNKNQPAFTLMDTLFAGIKGSFSYAPAFVDIDGDGNKDLALGKFDGKIRFYRNTRNASPPYFELSAFDSVTTTPPSNPHVVPALTDIDGDGDYDLFVGTERGTLRYYKNIGDRYNFIDSLSLSPFDTIDVGDNANPLFVDMDSDNDDDLFIGNSDGNIYFYENVEGQFVFRTTTYGGIHNLKESTPAFADIDGDGDNDIFVGTFKGGMHFYRNEAPLGVKESNPISQIPNQIRLEQNFPNPFNPLTIINYQLSIDHWVSLKIYDVLGNEVATLVNEKKHAGIYNIQWDATNLPSGIYIAKLTAGLAQDSKRMLFIK